MTLFRSGNDYDFILCEDARPETGDKITILGFFPGSAISFGSTNPPYLMSSLAFIYIIKSIKKTGKEKALFSLMASDKSLVIDKSELPGVSIEKNKSAVIVVGFKMIVLPKPGTYTATLEFDGNSYENNIIIA